MNKTHGGMVPGAYDWAAVEVDSECVRASSVEVLVFLSMDRLGLGVCDCLACLYSVLCACVCVCMHASVRMLEHVLRACPALRMRARNCTKMHVTNGTCRTSAPLFSLQSGGFRGRLLCPRLAGRTHNIPRAGLHLYPQAGS
jgi:hypothetical protein